MRSRARLPAHRAAWGKGTALSAAQQGPSAQPTGSACLTAPSWAPPKASTALPRSGRSAAAPVTSQAETPTSCPWGTPSPIAPPRTATSFPTDNAPPYLPHPAPRGCANPSLRMRLPPNRRLCVRRGHTPHSSLRPRRRRASSRRAPASPASAAPRTRNPRGWPAGGAQAQCAFPGSLVSAGPPPPHPSPRPPPPPPGAESRWLPRVREPRSAPAASGESRPRGAAVRPQAQVLRGWRHLSPQPRPARRAGPVPGPVLCERSAQRPAGRVGREGAARRLRPPHSPHSGLRSGTPVWAGRPRPGSRCCRRRPDGNTALRVRRGMTAVGGSAPPAVRWGCGRSGNRQRLTAALTLTRCLWFGCISSLAARPGMASCFSGGDSSSVCASQGWVFSRCAQKAQAVQACRSPFFTYVLKKIYIETRGQLVCIWKKNRGKRRANKVIMTVPFLCEILRLADRRTLKGYVSVVWSHSAGLSLCW